MIHGILETDKRHRGSKKMFLSLVRRATTGYNTLFRVIVRLQFKDYFKMLDMSELSQIISCNIDTS